MNNYRRALNAFGAFLGRSQRLANLKSWWHHPALASSQNSGAGPIPLPTSINLTVGELTTRVSTKEANLVISTITPLKLWDEDSSGSSVTLVPHEPRKPARSPSPDGENAVSDGGAKADVRVE